MYVIVKSAVYDQGVMWIGESLELAKERADFLADSGHDDGYHEYKVRLFSDPIAGSHDWIDQCECVYTAQRGEQ